MTRKLVRALPPRLRRGSQGLLAIALAVAPSLPARAQSEAEVARARELFVEGSKLAEAGDWEKARDRFERSLAQKRAALTLYNLGIAQQETGRIVAALESFRAFLALPVEPATQSYVEPVRAVVAKLEARVAWVEVEVRPASARGVVLRIDGHEVPVDGGARMLDPGHHDFVASAPGFCTAYVPAALSEGARARIPLLIGPAPRPPRSVALPTTLAATGFGLLVGGSVALGVGAGRGLTSPDGGRTMLVGGVVEGAGGLALGAAALILLTNGSGRAPATAVVPWSRGSVGGVEVRF